MNMKMRVLILVLGIAIFTAGCGNEEVKEPNGSQTVDSEKDVNTEADELKDYIASIKTQSDNLKDSLENDELTQLKMNEKSQELYELWDGALNDLWSKVKKNSSEEEFSKLLDEQRTWIAQKEKSVEKAGEEFKGGSLYALIVNMEAAEITEERVYELYELLK